MYHKKEEQNFSNPYPNFSTQLFGVHSADYLVSLLWFSLSGSAAISEEKCTCQKWFIIPKNVHDQLGEFRTNHITSNSHIQSVCL